MGHAGEAKAELHGALLPRPIFAAFGHVQYPGDSGCGSLKFGTAHDSTAAVGKKVPTPKSIDPETENRSVHMDFRSHHCTWRAEQREDFWGGVAKQHSQSN